MKPNAAYVYFVLLFGIVVVVAILFLRQKGMESNIKLLEDVARTNVKDIIKARIDIVAVKNDAQKEIDQLKDRVAKLENLPNPEAVRCDHCGEYREQVYYFPGPDKTICDQCINDMLWFYFRTWTMDYGKHLVED